MRNSGIRSRDASCPSRWLGGRWRTPRLVVAAVAAATLGLGAACGDAGGTASRPFEDVPATSSTTSGLTSATTVALVRPTTDARAPIGTAATSSTTPPSASQSTPTVTTSPAGAAPNALVSITGVGFRAENWKTPNVPLWLAGGPADCEFFAEADHSVRVDIDGRLSGTFVVPIRGACRQSSVGALPIEAGRYRIVYQCTACTIGEFTVTESVSAAPARCKDVSFAANSDDMAADIVAYGLECPEAEALVRSVAGPFGPINGAMRGGSDGFSCVQTGQQEGPGLPTSNYECTRGGQRITFIRT